MFKTVVPQTFLGEKDGPTDTTEEGLAVDGASLRQVDVSEMDGESSLVIKHFLTLRTDQRVFLHVFL